MERNKRKEYVGTVTSDKSDKTIKVETSTFRRHPLYGKRITYKKRYTVHDENNEAKVGDIVKIMETRPLSKTKGFRLVEIIKKSVSI